MNLDLRHESKQAERERVQLLADEAIALAKNLDLDRYPNLHISRALRGMAEGPEREHLFRQIIAELKRRGFKTPQEQRRENERLIREAKDSIIWEDSFTHEARIDPHEREDDSR